MLRAIKRRIYDAVCRSAANPVFFARVWHPLLRISQIAEHQQASFDLGSASVAGEMLSGLAQDLRVRDGPFKGMVYPDEQAVGSSLPPKLLGCYERELHGVIEQALRRDPEEVIDVGCAEGYYAVGIARRMPGRQVIAADPSEAAQRQCRRMAHSNGVADRVEIKSSFSPHDFEVRSGKQLLVISDCEGFENELFNDAAIGALKSSDVLIESHDFVRPFTTRRLQERFATTHYIQKIRSVPDVIRPSVFPIEHLAEITEDAQIRLMAELRPSIMTWLWMTPRKSAR